MRPFWESLPERAFDVRDRDAEFEQRKVEYVELCAGGVVVRWRDVASSNWPEPDPPLAGGRRRPFVLRDDLGTGYAVCSCGSVTDSHEQVGEVVFSPTVPTEAGRLEVRAAGRTLVTRRLQEA